MYNPKLASQECRILIVPLSSNIESRQIQDSSWRQTYVRHTIPGAFKAYPEESDCRMEKKHPPFTLEQAPQIE